MRFIHEAVANANKTIARVFPANLIRNLQLFRVPTFSNGTSHAMNDLCRDDIPIAKT
jgi:hypothetical protein